MKVYVKEFRTRLSKSFHNLDKRKQRINGDKSIRLRGETIRHSHTLFIHERKCKLYRQKIKQKTCKTYKDIITSKKRNDGYEIVVKIVVKRNLESRFQR